MKNKFFFLYGLFITLQQILFIFGSPKVAFTTFIFLCIVFYCYLTLKSKILGYIIIFKNYLYLVFSLYLLIVFASFMFIIELDYIRWFLGLTPFFLTIPIMNLTYSTDKKINISHFESLWRGIFFGSLFILFLTAIFGTFEANRLSYNSISASNIGRNSVVVIIYLLSSILLKKQHNKVLYYILLIVSISLLLLSSSKSSLLAVLFINIVLFYKIGNVKFSYFLIILLLIIIVLFTPIYDIFVQNISNYFYHKQTFTLTGRTFIWENIISLIQSKPYFGYGYNSVSLLLTPKYFDIWNGRDIIQAHNAWLQSLLNVGFVGTVLLFFTFLFLFIRIKIISKISKQLYIIYISLFIFFIIRGFTEASFANGYSIEVYWFVILVSQILYLTSNKIKIVKI